MACGDFLLDARSRQLNAVAVGLPGTREEDSSQPGVWLPDCLTRNCLAAACLHSRLITCDPIRR